MDGITSCLLNKRSRGSIFFRGYRIENMGFDTLRSNLDDPSRSLGLEIGFLVLYNIRLDLAHIN